MYLHKMHITTAIDLPVAQQAIAAALHLGNREAAHQSLNGSLLKSLVDIRFCAGSLQAELRAYFILTLHIEKHEDCYYEFHLSDKMEPFAIACVLDPLHGLLTMLTRRHVEHLTTAIANFKAKYNIANETYHYTTLADRQATDAFTQRGGASQRQKAHSSDFHLKIRIPTALYKGHISILHLFDFDHFREAAEPIRYQYSRVTVPWTDIATLLRQEAADVPP